MPLPSGTRRVDSQNMPVSVQILSQFPLLKPLETADLEQLSKQMNLRSFARRGMVVAKGSPVHELGFLVEGRLLGVDFTMDGRSVGLFFLNPGDYFGELAVIDGEPPSEFVVAAARSTVAFLEGRHARDLIASKPALATAVMARLAQRVRSVMSQRTLLSLPTPFQRLCVLLLQMAQTQGQSAIDPVPTHQELAITINASRETVTRVFQQMFLQEVLLRTGDRLELVNLEYLKGVAAGSIAPPKT